MLSPASDRRLPPAAMQQHADLEASLEAEEQALLQRAAVLERQVRQHALQKAAAAAARKQAEARERTEAELQRWQGELRGEVDGAVRRLNEQRGVQLERCAQFEETLQANIEAMQAMQHNVRRRAAALDTAFDACVQRLGTAYVDAVALRRQQQPSPAK